MKTKKSPLSISIFYWLTNISLGLLALALVAVIGLNIFINTDRGSDMHIKLLMPVKADLAESGILKFNKKIYRVEFVEAKPNLNFIDAPRSVYRISGIILLIKLGIVFFIAWFLRLFVKNVKEGEIFSLQNISFIKKLAYGLSGLWLSIYIYMELMYYFIGRHLEFDNMMISKNISSHKEILLIALFIWMLAYIFQRGLKINKQYIKTI